VRVDMELISKDTAIRVVDSGRNRQQLVDMMQAVPPVNAIEIPDGATNGDMIKAMFPKCEQKEHINNNGYFEMYFDNDLKNADYMRVSKKWWNAPYKGSEG
jgi:hypothetical protein